MDKMTWDEYFMMLMFAVSMKSKDESTHIGAIITNDDHIIVSVGYNGFPKGANDNIKERQKRPLKYGWFEHAERNAIYNAANVGSRVKDCIIYTNGIPCINCARAVIQVGIKEVVYPDVWNNVNAEKWAKEAEISKEMFDECGVKLRNYKGNIPNKIVALKRGVNYLNDMPCV